MDKYVKQYLLVEFERRYPGLEHVVSIVMCPLRYATREDGRTVSMHLV